KIHVNAINENNISFAVTDGDIASEVSISPNTTHGCLPISVNNQPEVLAMNGKIIPNVINLKYHLLFSNLFLPDVYQPNRPNKAIRPPIPVIILNTQNNKVTFGI